jgi:tetratricopeptide (TPR) repeat protein
VLFVAVFLLAAQPGASFQETFRAGLIALQKGDLPAALTSLKNATALAPADGRARIALAQAYWRSGDNPKAEESAAAAERLAPADPVVLDALVTFYSETGALKKASQAAAKLPPGAPAHERVEQIYFASAQPLLQQQKFGEAAALLEEARQAIPASAQIELALGVSYYGLRRFDDAADAFLRTIALAPTIDQPYVFLGKILDQIPSRQAAATERFAQYEANHPDSPTGYLLHARGLDAQSVEPEKARALLEKSLALDNSNPIAHFELGNLLDRSQLFEAAAAEFARAAALDPNDAATHYRLARDYDRIGKHDEAEAERRRHAELVKAQESTR